MFCTAILTLFNALVFKILFNHSWITNFFQMNFLQLPLLNIAKRPILDLCFAPHSSQNQQQFSFCMHLRMQQQTTTQKHILKQKQKSNRVFFPLSQFLSRACVFECHNQPISLLHRSTNMNKVTKNVHLVGWHWVKLVQSHKTRYNCMATDFAKFISSVLLHFPVLPIILRNIYTKHFVLKIASNFVLHQCSFNLFN